MDAVSSIAQTGDLQQYLVLALSIEQTSLVCLVQLHYSVERLESPSEVGIVLLEPLPPGVDLEETSPGLDLLEVDFLDDESLVIVYRVRGNDKLTNIATISYCELGYQPMQTDQHVRLLAREELMFEVVEQWKQGDVSHAATLVRKDPLLNRVQLSTTRTPIKRSRVLKGGKVGGISVALNGKQGRRVACVLDSKGMLESFDMEGDEEDIEYE
ncbi:hypothetical protein H0H87_000178 [Tephrocybe sp. NHM501043]|nr:hypothetical protein H0H87_000178 [Tephrocybe sp. NHM501043]